MDSFLSWLKRVWTTFIDWGKRQCASFMSWLTSSQLDHFARRFRIRGFIFLLLTPFLMFIPIYSLLGTIEMFSKGFGAGSMFMLFTICTFLVFIGLPLLIVYANFGHGTYGKYIQIGTGVILLGLAVFWGVRFYQSFLPSL